MHLDSNSLDFLFVHHVGVKVGINNDVNLGPSGPKPLAFQNVVDKDAIQTHARREQWISSPSPQPHLVMVTRCAYGFSSVTSSALLFI